MMSEWLRHAFAIPPASAFVPSAAEEELVRRVCAELVRRRLVLPASVLIESWRPMSSIGAQMVWFAYPWFAALTDAAGLRILGQMLERPGAVDYLLDRLQAADTPANVPAEKPSDVKPGFSESRASQELEARLSEKPGFASRETPH